MIVRRWEKRASGGGAIVFLATLALPGGARAQLVIDEGFESGVLPYGCSGNCPVVVEVPDARAGDFVMKSELTQSSEVAYRTEVSVNESIINFDVGEEYWLGISIKLGLDFDDPTEFNDQGMLLQWHYRDWLHPEVPDAQPLLLRYTSDDLVKVHNEVLATFLAETAPDYGQWVDWVVHVKFDDVDGINELWRNGVQVADFHGDTHQIEKVEGTYLKFGLYSSQYDAEPPGFDFTRTVFHDELRVAGADGSYELVAPPSPPGQGGSGGAAGGTGGTGGAAPGNGGAGASGAALPTEGGGGTSQGGAPGAGPSAPSDEGDCGCTMPGRHARPAAWLLPAALSAFVTARRRLSSARARAPRSCTDAAEPTAKTPRRQG